MHLTASSVPTCTNFPAFPHPDVDDALKSEANFVCSVFIKWLRVKREHEFEGTGFDHGRP